MEIQVEQLRQNDRAVTNSQGTVTGTLEKYVLTVLPKDILTVMRAVALTELDEQQRAGNRASQIIVDNLSVARRGIDNAMRFVKLRFMDVDQLIKATTEAYRLFLSVTRLQSPARNSLVARRHFHLYVDGKDFGLLPTSIAKLNEKTLNQDSVVRIVGPLVPYARKLFWNPVGTSRKMSFRKVKSTRGTGVRYLKATGASKTAPAFKPYRASTVKKLMRGDSARAQQVRSMVAGNTPPGRTENSGQIVKRVLRSSSSYRGLHFADGWIVVPSAATWSKSGDTRVPTISIQFSKRGATTI